MKYWVCFGSSDQWWGQFLKEGFQHVFVIADILGTKVWLNPHAYLEMDLMAQVEDLPDRLKDLGYTVLEVTPDCVTTTRLMRPMVLSCVEMTKYMLGIRVNGFTPWQLYRGLLKTKDAVVTQL